MSRDIARALVALSFLTSLLIAPGAARAGGTLDQTSPPFPGAFNFGASALVWQQQIKAGVGGTLAGITITLSGPAGSAVTVGVRKGAAWTMQPLVFQQIVNYPGPPFSVQQVFVDMTASNVILAAGEVFVMEIKGIDNGGGLSLLGQGNTWGYPEPLFLNGAASACDGCRLGFMTYMYSCAGPPNVCTAVDACHMAGICDPTSGLCSNPAAPDGTACDDGNACTQTDACVAGACTGANPIVCTAADACHVAGACDPTTAMCNSPVVADGTACDDGNACTQTDACVAGVCTGVNPVMCGSPPECQVADPCDMKTGACSFSPAPDGTMCPGGACMAGSCMPGMMGTGGSATTSGGTGGGGTGGGGGGGGGGTGGGGMAEGTTTGTTAPATSSTGGGGAPVAFTGCYCEHTSGARTDGAPSLTGLFLLLAAARRRSKSAPL